MKPFLVTVWFDLERNYISYLTYLNIYHVIKKLSC